MSYLRYPQNQNVTHISSGNVAYIIYAVQCVLEECTVIYLLICQLEMYKLNGPRRKQSKS